MSGERLKVGFIGLGRMGGFMAANILKAGFDLTLYNRTTSKMQPLIAKGAKKASSPREAASQVDVMITCLADDQSVQVVLTGEDGILAGLKQGGVHIATETIAPASATKFAGLHSEHGSHYIAGPVVGRPNAAEAAELITYIAGEPQIIEKCWPVMEAYTKQINNVGEAHSVANTVKLTINYMVISMVELMGQVYAFAEKSGMDLEFANEIMMMIINHPAIEGYTKRIRTRNFDEAAFELITGFKDVSLIMQASTDSQAPLPYISVIRDKFLAALAHDLELKDWSAIYEITRMNAGLGELAEYK
jgi:3-hydroxyisobutyrate dehydrogenase-like beta-hydroxyacid dehydrogenase